jgi:hypothetical protein
MLIGGAVLALLAGAAEAGSSRGGHGSHGGGGSSSAGQPRAEAEANATARQRQRQTQSQVARGGNARATGGRANATVIVNNSGGGASGGGTGVAGTPTGAAGTVGAGGGAGGDGAYHSTVSGTTTLRTAPDVAAPAIWSNNPCIISASGSVSVVGFGASIGAGIEDPDCTRRANAQLLAVLGQPDAAREVLCANREVREAFMRSGRPCAADAPNFRPVRATVAPAPAPAPAQPAPQPVAAPAPAAPSAWCQAQPGESAADRLMRQHNCR